MGRDSFETKNYKIFKRSINNFIKKYGFDFLTETVLRMLFIGSFKLSSKRNAFIEKPYLPNKNVDDSNKPILSISNILKTGKSLAHLDLYYENKQIKNYLEFKFDNCKCKDDPPTRFANIMNDLHRLSYISSKLCKLDSHFYFIYCYNSQMANKSNNWSDRLKCKINRFIYDINCEDRVYNAISFIDDNNDFWDTDNDIVATNCKEFRNKSFESFKCCDDKNKNGCRMNWRPSDCNFLSDITYSKIKFDELIDDCCLIVLEITKK